MTNLRKFSGSFFPEFLHGQPLTYFIKPLHGEPLKSDFPVDVTDKNGTYLVHAELPGVKKENIEISIDGNCFTISAEVDQYDQKSDEGRLIQSERYVGSISRTIQLPMEIDKNSSSAQFENGILELILAKDKKNAKKNLEIK